MLLANGFWVDLFDEYEQGTSEGTIHRRERCQSASNESTIMRLNVRRFIEKQQWLVEKRHENEFDFEDHNYSVSEQKLE